jgi:orotidine-5'-phosphate decarboxylase
MLRNFVTRSQLPLMVALDNPRLDLGFLAELISSMRGLVVGFKLGTPFLVSRGVKALKSLLESYSDIYFLADLKLADLPHIMEYSVEVVSEVGFRGVVAVAFVGYEGALDRLSRKCESLGVDLLLQVTYDHPSSYIIDSLYAYVKKIIKQVDPEGLIVPASKTTIIRDLRETFGDIYVILSPGIFVAGAEPGEGLCYGADVEVVGTRVVAAPSPLSALREVAEHQRKYLTANRDKCVGRKL